MRYCFDIKKSTLMPEEIKMDTKFRVSLGKDYQG